MHNHEHNKAAIHNQKIRLNYMDMLKLARGDPSVADRRMRLQCIALLGAFLALSPSPLQRATSGEKELPADLTLARSLVPAGTATLRDFSNIAPEIPEYIPENCTGCMDCVTECPDTAILGKVISETELEERLKTIPGDDDREMF